LRAVPTQVVRPGRDVAPAPGGPPEDLRRGRRVALLCVGNWVERKGTLDLLEALALLPPDAATLHLVGRTDVDPRYAARVERRIARGDLAGRVVVHGPVARERVAQLYRSADVFVLPSYREPYGTVYGEAMAAGLPVVGWRAGNLPNLARDGRKGLIVEPGDRAALAAALGRLAGDPELRRRPGRAAAERAAALPTWDETTARFVELRAAGRDTGGTPGRRGRPAAGAAPRGPPPRGAVRPRSPASAPDRARPGRSRRRRGPRAGPRRTRPPPARRPRRRARAPRPPDPVRRRPPPGRRPSSARPGGSPHAPYGRPRPVSSVAPT